MKKEMNKRVGNRFLPKGKKAMEMTINVVVIIVLAVLLLIGLIVILTGQTGIFTDFLNNLRGKTNVDAVVTACNSQVVQENVYEFCCVNKTVKYKFEGKLKEEEFTCKLLAEQSFTNGRINLLECGEC